MHQIYSIKHVIYVWGSYSSLWVCIVSMLCLAALGVDSHKLYFGDTEHDLGIVARGAYSKCLDEISGMSL